MTRNEKMLLEHIRPVTDEDREKLPMFSYSRIEQYKNCPMAYKFKYVNGKTISDETTLALELGTLCHYVLEQKGKMVKDGSSVKYDILKDILYNGVVDANQDNDKPTEKMLGVNDLKKKYFEDWNTIEPNSGMDYTEKIDLFWDKVVKSEMENDDWYAEYFEYYFEFVFQDRVILHGYIDRIDSFDGMFRTIDYKTSKKIYDQNKLSTSLQFGIYALAILMEFGSLPVESVYRFILIDEKQKALTVGWEKRLVKHLTDIFDSILADTKDDSFKPKPSPLCHWCSYCKHGISADRYKHECEYYSLWTPTNKTYSVNKKWEEDKNDGRKLIF